MFACATGAVAQELTPVDALRAANASDDRLDIELVDQVFDQAITETLSIDEPVEIFIAIATDEANPVLDRVKSHLTVAHLQWKYGQPDAALESIDQALAVKETTDGTLLKARLLDAGGDEDAAVEWYEKAVATTERSEEREFIRIRLTMVGVDAKNVDSLVELAEQRDQDFKNRAAITLAVLGNPEKALDLYQPDPESDFYFRQLVRVAEWALKAEKYELAAERAWEAYDRTEIRFDALYALTLVDEAYRNQDKLDELVAVLESRGLGDEDLLNLRIDLLIDLEDYDTAIALFQALNQDTSDVEARQRLIQIYDTAGKQAEMVSEYEKLIESEPFIVQWYVGLASYYINVAEPEKALEVWDWFERNNSDAIDILVRGAEFMNQMGYVDSATDMVKRHAEANGPSVYGNVFLFETYHKRGEDADAEATLKELWESLPPDSSDLRIVADGFERLNKYDRALDVFLAIQDHEGKLGYDDRMRLAWLHGVVGNKDIAINLWQEIWVQESSPARRSFAEGQFLLIAAELNSLADIAIDLENKLFAKEADQNDINLLVRIYTEVGDSFSASEIVEEFSTYGDLTEVERLRQLGLVYLQLSEFSKYDDVLRQLEQIDPENRIEHIQNIVLNLLAFDLAEESNERYDDIQHWLAELRTYDEEAVSGEFEASVLSMGGFSEEAIEAYRRALIEQPKHSDNLLLMADLMKESERTEEAVSLLQYVAEHASDDNEFVVAVDGIINMIGQRLFGQQLESNTAATFRWTHRVILERITGREDKFYLYQLLSEIAQETNDREAEFTAIENSVSQAGIRRLSVLREIVTMSTPNAGFFSMYQNEGDPERQITYGRRLIGLRQQLPPDVYISIARTLLTQGDTIGAEKSLALVRDITGQTDINKTKADLFSAAGYSKQALASYSQALSVNRDNLELQFKTAALRESNGQFDVANILYVNALDKIMRGLPSVLQAAPPKMPDMGRFYMPYYMLAGSNVNTSVTRNYRTYYELLMQGLISTWPKDDQVAQSRLDVFLELFDEELAKVVEILQAEPEELEESDDGKEEPEALTRFSRLDHVAQLIRRLCGVVDCVHISDSMDITLAQHFADDETFSYTLKRHYTNLGVHPNEELAQLVADIQPIEFPEGKSRLEFALEQAIDQKNLERLTRISIVVEPEESLEQLFLNYMTQEEEAEEQIPGMRMYNPQDSKYRAGLRYASVVFDDLGYTRLLNVAIPTLRAEPEEFLKFLVNDPMYLIEIEEYLGESIVEVDSEFLGTLEVQEALRNNYQTLSSLWYYVSEQKEIEELVTLMEMIVRSFRPNQFSMSYELLQAYKDFFSRPLSKELGTRVKDTIADLLRKVDLSDEYLRANVQSSIVNFDVHPDNVEIFLEVVDNVQAASRAPDSLVDLVRNYYIGDRMSAFKASIEQTRDFRMGYQIRQSLPSAFKEELIAVVDEIRNGNIEDMDFAMSVLDIASGYMSEFDPEVNLTYEERMELTGKVVEQFPDDPDLLLNQIDYTLSRQDKTDLIKYLRLYYKNNKSDEDIRTIFYFVLMQNENYKEALAIALDGGPDLRKLEVREEIYEKVEDQLSGRGYDRKAYMVSRVLGIQYMGTRPDFFPEGLKPTMERLQEIANSDDVSTDEIPELLRSLWRGTQASSLGDRMSYYGVRNIQPMLLQWPASGPASSNVMYMNQPMMVMSSGMAVSLGRPGVQQIEEERAPTLLEVLMSKAPLGRELETFLIAMPGHERKSSMAMYDAVSRAYREFPDELAQRLGELGAKIVARTADEHDLTMWLVLVLDSESEISEDEALALVERAKSIIAPSPDQLYSIARLLARVNQYQAAVECYELLIIEKIQYGEFSEGGGFYFPSMSSGIASQMSVLDLIADAKDRLPQDMAKDLVSRAIPLVRPFSEEPEIQHFFDAFVLRALSLVYAPTDVIANARKFVPDISESVDVDRAFDGVRLVHLAWTYYDSGDYRRATDHLRPVYMKESVDSALEQPNNENRMMYVVNRFSSEKARTIQNLANALGLYTPRLYKATRESAYGAIPPSAEMFSGMLSGILDLENEEAVNATLDALIDWLDDSEISDRAVIRTLSQVAQIKLMSEKQEEAMAIAANIQEWLLRQTDEQVLDHYLFEVWSLAESTGLELDTRLARHLVEKKRLTPQQIAAQLNSLQEAGDFDTALAIAGLLDTEFAGLSILREIREIAQAVSDEDYVAQLDDRISALEVAYDEIELAGGFLKMKSEEDEEEAENVESI